MALRPINGNGIRRCSLVLSVPIVLAACQFPPNDAEPTRTAETRQLIAGWYGSPLSARSGSDAIVVARRRTEGVGNNGIMVMPFTQPEQACTINADPDAFGPIRSSDEAVVQLFTYLDENYISDVAYFDTQCASSTLPAVSQASLFKQKVVYDGDRLMGVVAARTNGELVYADRDTGQTRVLSTDLADSPRPFAPFGSGDSRFWIQEATVVARDVDGSELGRFGTDVTEMVTSGERLAFVDDGDLFYAAAPGSVAILVAQDACQPLLNRFDHDGTEVASLTFLSPCDAAVLNAYDIDTAAVRSFYDNVSAWRTVGNWVFFETDDSTLRVVAPNAVTSAEIGADLHFEATIDSGVFLLRVDHPDNTWDLSRFDLADGLVPIAYDVDGYVVRTMYLVVVGGGSLTVHDTTDWTPRFERSGVDVLADPFMGDMQEVPYMVDYYSTRPSRLEFWSPDTNEATFVAHGADPFVFLLEEPERGLLYSIAQGEDQGIWLAQLP